MAYNILIGVLEVRVAYLAILGYIIFCLSTLCIVWLCFKERSGIEQMKQAPQFDGENYDPGAFNADVNIMMSVEIGLAADKFRVKREKTESRMIEMQMFPQKEAQSAQSYNNNESDNNDNMWNSIDLAILANNPLSNNNNNNLPKLQLQSSIIINKQTAINADSPPNHHSHIRSAIHLDDLPNIPQEINPYKLQKTTSQTSTNQPTTYIHLNQHSDKSEKSDSDEQVVISMNSHKKKEVRVIVEEEEDDENCLTNLRFAKMLNKLSMYTPIFFHFWDMATDIAVICDWIPDSNWNHPNSFVSPAGDTVNTFYFIIGSIAAQMVYRLVSGYRYAKRFHICGGFLQFLDMMIFFEIYASVNSKNGKSTLQLRSIRHMESVLESAPQALLQLVYVFTVNNLNSSKYVSFIVQASLLFSILSITSSVVRSDEWKVREETNANRMFPPHWRFLVRSIFRLCEISTRLCIMALLSQIHAYGLYIVLFIISLQIMFYLSMHRDGFLGNDLGNIIEILVVHPNLSLRLSDEELQTKIESTVGCIFRAVLCWTPISVLGVLCCSNRQKNKMCVFKNVVGVHYIHRMLESLLELSIFLIAFYLNNNKDITVLFTGDLMQSVFIIAVIGTLIIPFLYLISYQWFIIGGGEGLEMNIFGFLHHAHCEDDISQFIRYVYRVKSSVNNQNKFNRTPLMEAVLLKNYDLTKFLCEMTEHIDLSITDNYNDKQIIHYVAEIGDARLMKLVLDCNKKQVKDVDILNAVYGPHHKNALIICAEMGHYQCGELLLGYGADINYQDSFGRTALHYAIFGQSSSSLKSTQSELCDQYTKLIKDILSSKPNLNIVDKKREWTALFQAVGGGGIHIVDLLINIGLSPLDSIDINGESLLHCAVRYNRYKVLKYLLTHKNPYNFKWNLRHQNNNRETPLKLAIYGKYMICLRYLIKYGKECETSLMKGLLLAIKLNSLRIVRVLVREFKVDPNFCDKDEMTPLRWAAFHGYKSIMKELLVGGARDDFDQFGQNAVFYAAKNNHLHILQLLHKANADFCVVNFDGQTATDKTNNKETIQFIKHVRNMQVGYH